MNVNLSLPDEIRYSSKLDRIGLPWESRICPPLLPQVSGGCMRSAHAGEPPGGQKLVLEAVLALEYAQLHRLRADISREPCEKCSEFIESGRGRTLFSFVRNERKEASIF